MSEIGNFIFENMKSVIRDTVIENCKIYENEVFQKMLHYENNRLIGLAIYYDFQGIRYLCECHYTTDNRMLFFRDWRKVFDKKLIMRLKCQKVNARLLKFYKNVGFKYINEDRENIYLEYRRQ